MPEDSPAPIVRVVFACTGCSAPYEATQIRRRATSTFSCGLCGDVVWLWSGPYDYTDWRSLRLRKRRARVVRKVVAH